MVIAIDFDGTCVSHEFPHIGFEIGATKVLRELIDNGHSLILSTIRDGKDLENALNWFRERDIPLHGVQKAPNQENFTKSPKVLCQLIIDDRALGCPLTESKSLSKKPFADWKEIRKLLKNKNII